MAAERRDGPRNPVGYENVSVGVARKPTKDDPFERAFRRAGLEEALPRWRHTNVIVLDTHTSIRVSERERSSR
jgi:hypothetical protein